VSLNILKTAIFDVSIYLPKIPTLKSHLVCRKIAYKYCKIALFSNLRCHVL